MNLKEYHIEIITPCLCAGANQQLAEMRVPSIRGQLRWWFRALSGTREDENAIFGCIKDKAQKSNVTIRMQPPRLESSKDCHTLKWGNDDRTYLLWPLLLSRQAKQIRGMLSPGVRFTLQLFWGIDGRQTDNALIDKLDATTNLWILLGSIGTRSRRGMGSLWLANDPPQTEERFKELISDKLKKYFPKASIKVGLISRNQSSSSDDALKEVGAWLKQWRAGSSKSYSQLKQWGKNDHDAGLEKTKVVYRPVLGLPLVQRYSSKKDADRATAHASDGACHVVRTVETIKKGTDRWASPLHLKIIRLGSDYYPLAVYFPKHAMPNGEELELKTKTENKQSWKVTLRHDLINEMLKDITKDNKIIFEQG